MKDSFLARLAMKHIRPRSPSVKSTVPKVSSPSKTLETAEPSISDEIIITDFKEPHEITTQSTTPESLSITTTEAVEPLIDPIMSSLSNNKVITRVSVDKSVRAIGFYSWTLRAYNHLDECITEVSRDTASNRHKMKLFLDSIGEAGYQLTEEQSHYLHTQLSIILPVQPATKIPLANQSGSPTYDTSNHTSLLSSNSSSDSDTVLHPNLKKSKQYERENVLLLIITTVAVVAWLLVCSIQLFQRFILGISLILLLLRKCMCFVTTYVY